MNTFRPNRRKLVVILGSVDAGKTTITERLTNTKLLEYRGITQESRFFLIEDLNTIIVDTPGHEDFHFDRRFLLEHSDLILIVSDKEKLNTEFNDLSLQYSNKVVLIWTKQDINPHKQQLKGFYNLYLPGEFEDLKEIIRETNITSQECVAVILNKIILPGLQKGFEIIQLEEFLQPRTLFIGNQKVSSDQIINIPHNSQKRCHSSFSKFLQIDIDLVTLPCFLNINISKLDNTEKMIDSNFEIGFIVRAKSWGQIEAVKSLIKRLSYDVKTSIIYEGLGFLKKSEENLIKDFNLKLIEYFLDENSFKSLYDIEHWLKDIFKSYRIDQMSSKAILKVEKVFEKEGNRPKILGVQLLKGDLYIKDFLIMENHPFSILKITEKGKDVKNPTVMNKIALLLDNENFNVRKDQRLKVYDSKLKFKI